VDPHKEGKPEAENVDDLEAEEEKK